MSFISFWALCAFLSVLRSLMCLIFFLFWIWTKFQCLYCFFFFFVRIILISFKKWNRIIQLTSQYVYVYGVGVGFQSNQFVWTGLLNWMWCSIHSFDGQQLNDWNIRRETIKKQTCSDECDYSRKHIKHFRFWKICIELWWKDVTHTMDNLNFVQQKKNGKMRKTAKIHWKNRNKMKTCCST